MPNLGFSIKNNLASSIRNYLQSQGKTVSEQDLNKILQRMADVNSTRSKDQSIFSGGRKYLGGSGKDFVVQNGQQVNLSVSEYNKIFDGYLETIKEKPEMQKPEIKPEDIKPVEINKTNIGDISNVKLNVNEGDAFQNSLKKMSDKQIKQFADNTTDIDKLAALAQELGVRGDQKGARAIAKTIKTIEEQQQKNKQETVPGATVSDVPKTDVQSEEAQAVKPVETPTEKPVDAPEEKPTETPVTNTQTIPEPVAPKQETSPVEQTQIKKQSSNAEVKPYSYESDETFMTQQQHIKNLQSQMSEITKEFNIPENATPEEIKKAFSDTEKATREISDWGERSQARKNIFDKRGQYQKLKMELNHSEKNINAYKRTMDNWKDGRTSNYTQNNYNGIMEETTLQSGKRAYKIEGKFYAVGNNGLPDGFPDKPITE